MNILIEIIGWISTGLFLVSIIMPQRIHLHGLGVLTAVTTGIYAFSYGATAIWVKWVIAFFFHAFMWIKIHRQARSSSQVAKNLLKHTNESAP